MSARRLATLLPNACSELLGGGQPRTWSALAHSAAALLDDRCRPSTSYSPVEPASGPAVHRYAGTVQAAATSVSQWRKAHTAACPQHGPSCSHNHPRQQQSTADATTGTKPAPRRALTLEEVEKACRGCEKLVKRGGLVCNGCATVQPPDESLSYFELFSLPDSSFDLDPQLLEKRYKQLQWNLHPDKMGHKPAQEREFSAQHASLINLAYSILKSPLSRANYLLALKGVNAGEAFEGTIDDPELLMEVLEAREEVESTDDPVALSQLLARNRKQQEGLVARLSAAFRSGDMAAAVSLTHQLQYVAKLEQEIVKKLPQL
ncbi:hypothetical protein HYH02_004166 [Chlamydomonas schloesseri]|uniref:J domain-containing protein n=1 Tax=Chlamydomonas schloesseri TaxID=2026947 RepID=A0A836B9H8_9CHLO|nr:hypothetical protein HYH02_004166 [Chlamydomonas schloesseri]|eukprot:KAG2451568.1 hypothetical protein HYH02_004166 [Chlamydomonas schloesseri]